METVIIWTRFRIARGSSKLWARTYKIRSF